MEIPEGYMLMAADKSGVVTSKWACLGAGRTPKAEAFESIVSIKTSVPGFTIKPLLFPKLGTKKSIPAALPVPRRSLQPYKSRS